MAKGKRGGKQSPQRYVADLVELVGALANMPRNGGNGTGHVSPPVMDPSVNVKELVELRADYEEKIRTLDANWQQRFDRAREATYAAQQEREASRIDAKLVDITRTAETTAERLSNAAITLANTVATTADAAQKAVQAAAATQSELVGQVRDTVSTLQTAVTSIIAAGGGRQAQVVEQTGAIRFASERMVGWVTILVGIIAAAATIAFTVHSIYPGK
jgi:hypothetical protein